MEEWGGGTYLASVMTTELSGQLSGSCQTVMHPLSSELANWPWELVARSVMGEVCPFSWRVMVIAEPCAGTESNNMGPSEVPEPCVCVCVCGAYICVCGE